MAEKVSLIGLDRPALKAALVEAGIPQKQANMRTGQLWNWLYVHGAPEFAQMSNLAKDFRALLEERFTLARPQIVTAQVSQDGTRKWLLKTGPGIEFETVYIPEEDRGTLCVSSQVGCTLTCKFCHTGTQKLVRNLTPAEILAQLFIARDALEDWPSTRQDRKVTNVVMMGMGEPLYNFDNVKAALAVVTDGGALALSKRRVTLSTAGVVPMIPRAGAEIGSGLAISLHAVRDALRDVIVPINKKYPIAELLQACRDYPGASNARRITFEYVMLKGVNDSLADAKELVRLVRGIPAKINLIPFNPWPGAPYECSDWAQIEKFAEIVNRAGYASPVRTPRGRDIMAACGQLKSESVKERASARMAREQSAHLARMPH
ncbi:MAG: 23S rRNA (adenine(2503)-C(2))-methyltransferase RlmN [Alphaproteobacteria bacterium]|nr:23S rRNA (adenine(2503)-C(2))-methyltransferase RlmN [Alphaproteobacteria bacterium]